MEKIGRQARYYYLSFLKYDLKASVTVFFVALPLCLGISLASGVPVYSGLIAGIIGGLIITLISKSELSVSGPAAGLTAISAAAVAGLGSLEVFFLSVLLAGIFQILLALFRLGGFTHFIPSSVIKGMLAAIGILLISKQIPLLVGFDQPDFWRKELFNIVTFNHGFQHVNDLYHHSSAGSVVIALFSLLVLIAWRKLLIRKVPFIPASFVTVVSGIFLAMLLNARVDRLQLHPSQFVTIPEQVFSGFRFPELHLLLSNIDIWKNAVVICFVASLETLLSIEAIDKLDPYNRITSQNRELLAQGVGNAASGLLGGLPITAVIVRSSANAEAGARTKLSSFAHGLWLLLAVVLAVPLLNKIPYCVLAVILIRTGYNLAKPKMIRGVYRQGREQFLPFLVTVVAILFTDLLIGVIIGIVYSLYFLVKHTYRAGYTVKETSEGNTKRLVIDLALNVSFLNKKKFMNLLDKIPGNSEVEINGTHSVYIDHDILEIFHDFKSKAKQKNIRLTLRSIPEVETIELH